MGFDFYLGFSAGSGNQNQEVLSHPAEPMTHLTNLYSLGVVLGCKMFPFSSPGWMFLAGMAAAYRPNGLCEVFMKHL